MTNYFLSLGGGLGDVIIGYLLGTGRLKALRVREPDCHIRFAIISVNPEVNIFFENCNLVDEIIYAPWNEDQLPFWSKAGEGRVQLSSIESELEYVQPEIFMDEAETIIANELKGEKYVAFHPFAGSPERDWQHKINLIEVIDKLCDSGIRVVLLGGSSKRIGINLIEQLN